MSPLNLFFDFSGRISRKWFWIGFIVLNLITWNYLLFNGVSDFTSMSSGGVELSSLEKTKLMRLLLIISGLLAWPALAIGYKRRHDLGKSGKPFGIVYIAHLFLMAASVYGLIPEEGTVAVFFALTAIGLFVAQIYFQVEMGFFKGTEGDNPWGSDPLSEERKT